MTPSSQTSAVGFYSDFHWPCSQQVCSIFCLSGTATAPHPLQLSYRITLSHLFNSEKNIKIKENQQLKIINNKNNETFDNKFSTAFFNTFPCQSRYTLYWRFSQRYTTRKFSNFLDVVGKCFLIVILYTLYNLTVLSLSFLFFIFQSITP